MPDISLRLSAAYDNISVPGDIQDYFRGETRTDSSVTLNDPDDDIFPQKVRVTMTVDTLSDMPKVVAVANTDEQRQFLVPPSATQDRVHVRGSSLSHGQKADFDAQQQKPDFATRDAKLDEPLNKHLPDSMPRKQTSPLSQTTPTPKPPLTRGQPTQFWKFWKTLLSGQW